MDKDNMDKDGGSGGAPRHDDPLGPGRLLLRRRKLRADGFAGPSRTTLLAPRAHFASDGLARVKHEHRCYDYDGDYDYGYDYDDIFAFDDEIGDCWPREKAVPILPAKRRYSASASAAAAAAAAARRVGPGVPAAPAASATAAPPDAPPAAGTVPPAAAPAPAVTVINSHPNAGRRRPQASHPGRPRPSAWPRAAVLCPLVQCARSVAAFRRQRA
ncbi:unnamed protein product [Urochloa humidicola]